MTKYPELRAALDAADNVVAYMTAYMRLNAGWSMERATTTPTRAPKVRLPVVTHSKVARRTYQWERPEWKRIAERPTPRKRYTPRLIEDTSPLRIRKLRAAYCDEFIKTGVLNDEIAAQLRKYADEKRASAKHSVGVPPQHEDRHLSRAEETTGDNGAGGGHSVDERTAAILSDYLRQNRSDLA